VLGLRLANAGGLPREPGRAINQPLANPVRRWLRERYRSRAFWREMAGNLHVNESVVTPQLAERFYLMNTMRGRGREDAIGVQQFDIGDAPGFLARIRQPVLILWAAGSFLPQTEADRYQAYLQNAPARIVRAGKLGHMFAEDDPALTAALFDRFAQSVLDDTWPLAMDGIQEEHSHASRIE
jgi:pimeloyl-ACP methyl ester carboxylesterase